MGYVSVVPSVFVDKDINKYVETFLSAVKRNYGCTLALGRVEEKNSKVSTFVLRFLSH